MTTYSKIKIATLCDTPQGDTCSAIATRYYFPDSEIVPSASFEDAADAVETGEADRCFVPTGYPMFTRILFRHKIDGIFVHRIPDLVLVGIKNSAPDKSTILFHHPAVEPLLPLVDIDFTIRQEATSNTKVCELVLQAGGNALGITNSAAASTFGLYRYSTLASKVDMPFVLFQKR